MVQHLHCLQDDNAHLNTEASDSGSEGEEDEEVGSGEEDADLGDEDDEPEDNDYMQRLAKEAIRLKVHTSSASSLQAVHLQPDEMQEAVGQCTISYCESSWHRSCRQRPAEQCI